MQLNIVLSFIRKATQSGDMKVFTRLKSQVGYSADVRRTRKKLQSQNHENGKTDSNASNETNDINTALARKDLTQVIAAAVPEPSSRVAHIFVGEGGFGAILDAVEETADRHFRIFMVPEKALAVEDLQYLNAKGCFTLPKERRQLLQAYFQFVHPSFPVIDANAFLAQYAAQGFEGLNLLLLWSIFSVSASYVPSLLPGRKECKEVYSARAKLLFDLGQENDKIVLVQSALLMSHWYSNSADVKQSWYWTGIAFSISQSFGLHALTNNRPRSQEEALWHNIWHCCLLRDTWQAFGRGRPLRISSTSSDINATDIPTYQLADLVLHGELLYSPREAVELETLWQNTISISNVLRDILTTKRPLSPTKANDIERKLRVLDYSDATFIIQHAEHHLELRRCATRIAWAKLTQQTKEQELASNGITAVLYAFIDGCQKSPVWAAPFIIPLLVPAIATYLTALKNKNEHASAQLGVYEHFLATIEDNYPAASMLKGVMIAAKDAILNNEVGDRGNEQRGIEFWDQFEGFENMEQNDLFDLSWIGN